MTELPEEELEEALRVAAVIDSVDDTSQISLIERNYRQLAGLRYLYNHDTAKGLLDTSTKSQAAAENLVAAVVNWLTAARLFHDHTLAKLSRLHGKESAELAAFKAQTSLEFDTHFSYRFLYKLRNYTQHIGYPVSSVQAASIDPANPQAGTHVQFMVDPKKLLAEYAEWGPLVKRDLENAIGGIDILAMIDDCMSCWRRLYSLVFEQRVTRAREFIPRIQALAEKTENQEGIPFLIEISDPDSETGNLTLRQRRIPIELAEGLLDDKLVAAKIEDYRSGKSTRLAESVLNISDSDREVAEIGTALMRIFFDEGTSEKFDEEVHEYATRHGSLRPIVYGLVRICGIGLHLAGAALGTTAEDIVAGILSQHDSRSADHE